MAEPQNRTLRVLALGALAYFLLRRKPAAPTVPPSPPVEVTPRPPDAPPPVPDQPEALGLSAAVVAIQSASGALREQVRLEIAGDQFTHPDLAQALRVRDGDVITLTLDVANPAIETRRGTVHARLVRSDTAAIVAYFWRDDVTHPTLDVPANSTARMALASVAQEQDLGPDPLTLDLEVQVFTQATETLQRYVGTRLFQWGGARVEALES